MTEIQQIQAEIDKLQERLDKCNEVKPFACKGEWHTTSEGYPNYINNSRSLRQYFNYWQTKEIAEKAYQLQLRQRKMLSFVSQHQKLDEGEWYIYKFKDVWNTSNTKQFCPDGVAMNKKTADKMLEAIENKSLDLS